MPDAPLDLRPDHLQIVREILHRHVPEREVWAFGSRAKWMAKEYSDLDLAVIGDQPLPLSVSAALADDFADSDLPFKVDVVDWATTSESFRDIIEKQRVVVQKRHAPLSVIGSIPTHWGIETLGEICRRSGGGIQTGPFGSQLHASDYVSAGIPSIMPLNIGDNRVVENGVARISAEDAKRLGRYLVRKGDIVYSRRGDVEKRALIRDDEDGWLCGTGCLRVRFGGNIVDSRYASYYLGHPGVREWIVRHAHGATMPNLNTAILAACPFVVPPLEDQRAIAHILGTLDDKIDLNRRQNTTLEAMARAIFKSWFVDFDPVRAKAAGRQPFGMDAATAALFPNGFEDSEVGEIPQGWRTTPVGELADVVGGSTPRTKEVKFWEGGSIYWATPKDLSHLPTPVLLNTDRRITDAGVKQISSGLLPPGTVLLSSRAPIGYLAITEVPIAINQGFIAMKPKENVSNLFLWLWAEWALEEILSRANGSTFLEISKGNFRPIIVVTPPAEVFGAFDNIVRPLYERIVANEREFRTLATQRDTLLSKLMSGEIRIPRELAA